jgi:hypothetical protein
MSYLGNNAGKRGQQRHSPIRQLPEQQDQIFCKFEYLKINEYRYVLIFRNLQKFTVKRHSGVNPLWLTDPSPEGVINSLIDAGGVQVDDMQRSASDMSFCSTDKNSEMQPLKFEYLPNTKPPIPPAPQGGFFLPTGK